MHADNLIDRGFWLQMKFFSLSENSISSPTAIIFCLAMENKTISFMWVKQNAKLKNNKKIDWEAC